MRSFVPEYDLITAGTLDDALTTLASGEGWRPIAGGTDLMVLFNAGKLPYRKLVSILQIPELRQISTSDTEVFVGATATYTQIRGDDVLRCEFPLLCAAASWTGGIANQNRGTIGGNIINASPAADSCPALLVYDAELQLVSLRGCRRVTYGEFHKGYKQLDLLPDELLFGIHLRRRVSDWKQYSRKVGPRRAQAISKVCLAATALLQQDVIGDIRIAAASVAPIPIRCRRTESALHGKSLSPETIAIARDTIANEVEPIDDIRSTRDYRRLVTANLLAEFLGGLK